MKKSCSKKANMDDGTKPAKKAKIDPVKTAKIDPVETFGYKTKEEIYTIRTGYDRPETAEKFDVISHLCGIIDI